MTEEQQDKSTKDKIREMFDEDPDLTDSDTKVALKFVERSLPEGYMFDVDPGDLPSIGTITKSSRVLRNQSDWSPGSFTPRNIPSNSDWETEFNSCKEYMKSLWEEDEDLVGDNTATFLKMVKQASSIYLPVESSDIPDIGDVHRRHRELRTDEGYDQFVRDEVDDERKEKSEAYENGAESKNLEEDEVLYGEN